MPFLTTAQYPAIRVAIDVTITEAKLPDATIAQAPYHPAAEAEVAARLGILLAAATGQEGAKRAVILLTAAKLVPALPSITRRTIGDSTTTYQREKQGDRARALRRDALDELAALKMTLTGETATVLPTIFTTVPGGRVSLSEGTAVPTFP